MPDLIDQKRAAPVDRAARYRIKQVTEKRPRAQRIENNGHLTGWNLARAKPADGAIGGLSADLFGRRELMPMPGGGHPVVTLHAGARLRDRNTDQGCPRAFVRTGKPAGVGQRHPRPCVVERCAFRVRNRRVRGKCSFLGSHRQADTFFVREILPCGIEQF